MNTQTALEKTRQIIRRKHLALATEETCCQWLSRFARFVADRKPAAEALSVKSPLEFTA